MFDYLAFIYAGLIEPGVNARNDGETLAKQCLEKLDAIDNKERFPPKLLILLASPAYKQKRKAEQLLNGVNDIFADKDVQLIGSSVAGVFYDRKVHPRGALLVCLASPLLEAKVAVGLNARQNPQAAVNRLLKKLGLYSSTQLDINPLANRTILTFMPGCNKDFRGDAFYPAPGLHKRLQDGLQSRIWVIGGVSSSNDRTRQQDGYQFAGRQVLKDSIAVASIITGVPIGLSLNDSLIGTKRILRVTDLGSDGKTVTQFDDRPAAEQQLNSPKRNFMLAKLSADGERTVDVPLTQSDGSVQLLRHFERKDYFQVFRPGVQVAKTALRGINAAKKRVFVERPIASLLLTCKIYSPRSERGLVRAERTLTQIEKSLRGRSKQRPPCVGGFFDGEIGVDEKGRPRLTNGGIGYIIFGDEMRERTPLYRGVNAMAEHGKKLISTPKPTAASIYETIRNALQIVTETGFPGAMLSLLASNFDRGRGEKERQIIAREATGSRFVKIIEHTKRKYDGRDVLAIVAREKTPRFIPDSRRDRYCNRKAIEISGIISQYILPLKRLDGSVFGTLQVDLGDLRRLSPEAFAATEKARMINSLGEVFSASINRVANAVENQIKENLDEALKASLSATDFREGLDRFVKAAGQAFGVEMGHLRLLKTTQREDRRKISTLTLETGFGACYEAERIKRRELDPDEFSPICCAFRSDNPHIVNDVSKDLAFKSMLRKVKKDPALHERLNRTRSYAAVSFVNEHGKRIGAISFGSTKPWFFLKLHHAALEALAERLGYLVQHLKAKIERSFLQAVSPKWAKRDLAEDSSIFREVTEAFLQQLNAQVASLYLEDKDRDKYILRAQANWSDSRWEHAASYDKTTGWMGNTAINKRPLYVADLNKYYMDQGYEFPHGLYAKYMFSEKLSPEFTVEAIGLPLRMGRKKNDKFGVLMLYRQIERGQSSGFAITDIKLLQEGADQVAGIVNAVMRHRDVMWEQQEEHRHKEFHRAINAIDDVRSLEKRICAHILSSFYATRADFYQVGRFRRGSKPTWTAGAHRDPETKTIESTKNGNADSLILNALSSTRVTVERKELTPVQENDPDEMKTANMVHRACVPVVGGGRLLGILDIRWTINPEKSFSLKVQHDTAQLGSLGKVVGSVCRRNQIVKEREQSDLALQATAAYASQRAHRLRNTVQDLSDRTREVRKGSASIDTVIPHVNLAMNIVSETTSMGKQILYPSLYSCRLSDLIRQAFDKDDGALKDKFDSVSLKQPRLSKDFWVNVDPRHTQDAFFNLLNNAADAIDLKKRRGAAEKPRIEIVAFVMDEERLKVVISDNGIGMTEREKRNALRGFVRSGDHEGVGVLISRVLLAAQGGSLDFKSKKFVGTETIVILPSAEGVS